MDRIRLDLMRFETMQFESTRFKRRSRRAKCHEPYGARLPGLSGYGNGDGRPTRWTYLAFVYDDDPLPRRAIRHSKMRELDAARDIPVLYLHPPARGSTGCTSQAGVRPGMRINLCAASVRARSINLSRWSHPRRADGGRARPASCSSRRQWPAFLWHWRTRGPCLRRKKDRRWCSMACSA